jgi:hypothetical protein
LAGVSTETPEDLPARAQEIALVPVPGRPSSLYVVWIASTCEREFLLRMPASGEALEVVVLDAGRTPVCDLLPIEYRVRLDFVVSSSSLALNASLVRP